MGREYRVKKITLLAFSMFLLLGLIACSNQKGQGSNSNDQKVVITQELNSNKKDVKKAVWGQLSLQQKERIIGTWKDSKVLKVTLTKDMMSQIKDNSYEGKEVYLIHFPTKDKFEPNSIAVYADENTFNYIGDALVY